MTAKTNPSRYFYLQCILGLMAGAALAFSLYCAMAAKTATTGSLLLATNAYAATAVSVAPILPLFLFLGIVAAIVLISLACCDPHPTTYHSSNRCYTHRNRHTIFVDPCIINPCPTPIYTHEHHHGHGHHHGGHGHHHRHA